MSIDDPKQFEASLAELETLVERLEQSDLTLEESLWAFERGINLTRACQRALEQAEQRVRILLDGSADATPQPFAPPANGAGASDRIDVGDHDGNAGGTQASSPAAVDAAATDTSTGSSAAAYPPTDAAPETPDATPAPRRGRARRSTRGRTTQNPNDDLPL